jgi:ubiquitin C-terminal hydrolase
LIEENQPLIKSIQATFATEEIDEYKCDKCNSPQKATISQKIIRTPPYLSITINRFTEGFGFGRKDNKTFTLDNDEFLDLSSVITDGINKQYSLMSMIDHHGSMRGGHYISHIKHVSDAISSKADPPLSDGPKPGQWYLYDDDSVHELSKPHISQSTYMIFLRRI